MKFAVFSDLHANYYAIRAAGLDAAEAMEVPPGNFWCLGDVLGYGPHPAQALRFLRDFVDPAHWVMGNHDAMLADLLLPGDSGKPAFTVRVNKGDGREIRARGLFLREEDWFKTTQMPVEVIRLNRAALEQSPEEDAFWRASFTQERARPLTFEQDGLACILVHGAHADPLSRYIYAWNDGILIPRELRHLKAAQARPDQTVIQFYGHTHVPTFVRARLRNAAFDILAEKTYPNQTLSLEEGAFYLVNPGSVGQPRDRDQRAAYLVFDSEARTITFRRVRYDYTRAAADLAAGNYPESLIRRLHTAAAAEKDAPDEWLKHFDEARTR
jgi:predicted phosphodiesterase